MIPTVVTRLAVAVASIYPARARRPQQVLLEDAAVGLAGGSDALGGEGGVAERSIQKLRTF